MRENIPVFHALRQLVVLTLFFFLLFLLLHNIIIEIKCIKYWANTDLTSSAIFVFQSWGHCPC